MFSPIFFSVSSFILGLFNLNTLKEIIIEYNILNNLKFIPLKILNQKRIQNIFTGRVTTK